MDRHVAALLAMTRIGLFLLLIPDGSEIRPYLRRQNAGQRHRANPELHSSVASVSELRVLCVPGLGRRDSPFR